MNRTQVGLSAAAVIATGAVTAVCLTDMGSHSTAPDASQLILVALATAAAMAPPLLFGALSLRRNQSIESALAQLVTTLGVAGLLSEGYLDVAFQLFGPNRRSSTEAVIFVLGPPSGLALGLLTYAVVWAVAKLVRSRRSLAPPEAPSSRGTTWPWLALAAVSVGLLANGLVANYQRSSRLAARQAVATSPSPPPAPTLPPGTVGQSAGPIVWNAATIEVLADAGAPPRLSHACERDDAHGCFILGLADEMGAQMGLGRNLLRPSEAVDQKRASAVELYEKACNWGYGPGCRRLGDLYTNGQLVPKDLTKAATFYAAGKKLEPGAAPPSPRP